MERGTVSMRVALVLRSAEVQPLFQDLCDVCICSVVFNSVQVLDVVNPPPPIRPLKSNVCLSSPPLPYVQYESFATCASENITPPLASNKRTKCFLPYAVIVLLMLELLY